VSEVLNDVLPTEEYNMKHFLVIVPILVLCTAVTFGDEELKKQCDESYRFLWELLRKEHNNPKIREPQTDTITKDNVLRSLVGVWKLADKSLLGDRYTLEIKEDGRFLQEGGFEKGSRWIVRDRRVDLVIVDEPVLVVVSISNNWYLVTADSPTGLARLVKQKSESK
jgi:hypothetical protein